jgi:transcriptional regulator with XRE-family HTH domain
MSPIDLPRVDHPLKLLRTIIGISQEKFAEAVGISLDSVTSAEVGRRAGGKLSETQREQIQFSIGAIWDERNREWYFDPGGFAGRRKPYAREHYETFRLELKREAHQRALLVYYLTLRFHDFCSSIPDAAFNGWFWRLEQQFDKWRKEFKLETKPEFEFDLQPLWDSELGRTVGYIKVFPDLLSGDPNTVWLKMVADAQKGKEQMMERAFPKKTIVPKTRRSKAA